MSELLSYDESLLNQADESIKQTNASPPVPGSATLELLGKLQSAVNEDRVNLNSTEAGRAFLQRFDNFVVNLGDKYIEKLTSDNPPQPGDVYDVRFVEALKEITGLYTAAFQAETDLEETELKELDINKKQIDLLKNQVDALLKNQAQLDDRNSVQKEKLASNINSVIVLQRTLTETVLRNNEVKRSIINQWQTKFKERDVQFQSKLDKIKTTVQAKFKSNKEYAEGLIQQVSQLQQAKQAIEVTLAKTKKEKDEVIKELQKVKGENDDLLKSKKDALDKLHIEKAKIVDNLQSDNKKLQDELVKSEKELKGEINTLKIENSTLNQQIETLRQFKDNLEAIQSQPPPPPSQTSVMGVVGGVGVGVKRRLQELIQKKPCAEGMDDVIYVLFGERCKGNRMKFLQESLNKL